MTQLRIKNVSKMFNLPSVSSVQALKNISLTVAENQFVSVIGPSGCGKSTLLNCISGLVAVDAGDIVLNGRSIKDTKRNVSYMMQDDCMLPWRSVLDNVILPLEINGIKKKIAREEALPYLKQFGLEQFVSMYPSALSGGMRKRAALLRTYLCKKDVMLLDEPFGSLDALTKVTMQEWFLSIWQHHKKTVLFVTHDIDEAIFLSDRIYVFSKRPGEVIAEIRIPFKRPRQRGIIAAKDFIQIKRRLLAILRCHFSHPVPSPPTHSSGGGVPRSGHVSE